MTTRLELLPDVYLTAVQTSRFKTACFSLSFLWPLRQEEAGMNALLPSVLLRGSESAPSIRAIADRLDALCGASVGSLVRKKGEIQLTGLFADGLEDRYAGEPVFSRLLELTAELLLRPRTQGGVFVPQIVMQERQMCRGEAYAVGRLGEAGPLAAVDEAALWAHYQKVLASSRAELFYLGSKPAQEVAALLRPLLKDLPRGACVPVSTAPGPQPKALRRTRERLPLAHVHDLHLVAQRRAEGDAVVIELVHVEHGVHQRLLAADVGAHLLGGLPVDVDLLAQDLADLLDLGGKQDAVGFHGHCSPFA